MAKKTKGQDMSEAAEALATAMTRREEAKRAEVEKVVAAASAMVDSGELVLPGSKAAQVAAQIDEAAAKDAADPNQTLIVINPGGRRPAAVFTEPQWNALAKASAEVDAAIDETEAAVRERVGAALFGPGLATEMALAESGPLPETPAGRIFAAMDDDDMGIGVIGEPTLDLRFEPLLEEIEIEGPDALGMSMSITAALDRLRALESDCVSGGSVGLADIRQLIAMLDPPRGGR